MTSVPLPALLDVLDRASDLKGDAHAATPVSRTDLIAAAVAQAPEQPRAVLEQAVDAHLAHAPRRARTTPAMPWGWRRPAQIQQLTRAQAWLKGRSARALEAVCAYFFSGPIVLALMASLGSGLISGYVFASVGVAWLIFLTLTGTWALQNRRAKACSPAALDAKQCASYLAVPDARAYLHQVLTSAVPEVLNGDVAYLEKLWYRHLRAEIARSHRERAQQSHTAMHATLQRELLT